MFVEYPFTDALDPIYNRLWEGPGDYLWYPPASDVWRRGLYQEQENVELGESEEVDQFFSGAKSFEMYFDREPDENWLAVPVINFNAEYGNLSYVPVKHIEFDNIGLLVV